MGVLTMGDVFGEVAFLTGRPRTATVIAETGAECLEIGSEAWTGILGRHPARPEGPGGCPSGTGAASRPTPSSRTCAGGERTEAT